jgi:hypothetical protein
MKSIGKFVCDAINLRKPYANPQLETKTNPFDHELKEFAVRASESYISVDEDSLGLKNINYLDFVYALKKFTFRCDQVFEIKTFQNMAK